MIVVYCYIVLIVAHLVRLVGGVVPNDRHHLAIEAMIALAIVLAYTGLMGVQLYAK